jgi:hypothetical protein
MFLAIKAFFLGCGDQTTVLDESSGGVTVVRVYPQNVQAFSLPEDCGWELTVGVIAQLL